MKCHVIFLSDNRLATYKSNDSNFQSIIFNLLREIYIVILLLFICNNDYGINIGQVTSSRLCSICTNLRILSEIPGVSWNKQNEGKISILGSQKSKKVTKILHSHQ